MLKTEDFSKYSNTSLNFNAKFALKYKSLIIGYLIFKEGIWEFFYSEEFKMQNNIKTLTDFPDKDKLYNEKFLWPFFAHRIPGLGQPQIQEIIKLENLNAKNEIDLLRRFGRKSITNPFVLDLI